MAPKRPGSWSTFYGETPPDRSPQTPRIRERLGFNPRSPDTPISSPMYGRPGVRRRLNLPRSEPRRWVSFGRIQYEPRPVPAEPRPVPASYTRMQAFEIETPMAVPESTGVAFSTTVVEFAAFALLFHFYNKVVPRGRDPADWNRRIMDWIDKYIRHKPQAAPPRTVISGTSQPKAHCAPGFPNTFTTAGPSPIAAS